jgi:hypothetical protein
MFGIVSRTSDEVLFNPRVFGLPAVYIRNVEDKEGNLVEKKTKQLLAIPQRQYQANDKNQVEIGVRATFIWIRRKDLVWANGDEITPEKGDEIAIDVYKELQVYVVSTKGGLQMPAQYNGLAMFGHEDGVQTILTIQAIRKI